VGGHTNVEAIEAGRVGNNTVNFTWSQTVWTADTTSARILEISGLTQMARSQKFADVDESGLSFKKP